MMFDLEEAIKQWLHQLRKSPGFEDGDIAELEVHLRDHIEVEMDNGSTAEQSYNKATASFGPVDSAGDEMLKSRSIYEKLPKNRNLELSETTSTKPLVVYLFLLYNYLKITARNFRNDRTYVFINVAGLTAGMIVFCLIMLYVKYEYSVDQYHENKDFIYRIAQQEEGKLHMGDDRSAVTMAPLGPTIKEEFSEVEYATRIMLNRDVLIRNGEEVFLEPAVYGLDPDAFKIFTFEYLHGNPDTYLKDKYSVVITESIARKYFEDTNPAGKSILLKDEIEFEVVGVIKDMPANSHFRMDIMVPFETMLEITERTDLLQNWGANSNYTYLLLNRQSDPSELESKFPSMLEKYIQPVYTRMFLQDFSNIHTHSDVAHDIAPTAPKKRLLIFITISIFILLIACINYINLATARATRMVKEVGIRKVIGATRGDIITQFLGESFLLTFFSILLALILVALALPSYRQATELDLTLGLLLRPQFILTILLAGGVVGIVSGSYPAFVVSARKPITALKGNLPKSTRGLFMRYALVIIQFSISGCLIISTFFVAQQLAFIQNRDMGFSREHILTLRVNDLDLMARMPEFKEELRKIPGVLSVSSSTNLPHNINSSTTARWPGKPEELKWPIYSALVDDEFVDLFDIEIVQGRNFSREEGNASRSILINEAAARSLPWEEPVGEEMIYYPDTFRIIGVMKDFHLHSLHLEIMPLHLLFNDYTWDVSMKISAAGIVNTIADIKNTKESLSEKYPFTYTFFEAEFDKAYKTEMKTGELAKWFAFIAIIIACLGLFGMATLTGEQRIKEIGIRKIQGATVFDLVFLLSKNLTRLVIIAFMIAAPVSYYFMHKWLNDFAYHIKLGAFVFLGTLFIMLALSWMTIGYRAYRFANSNPVDALRDE